MRRACLILCALVLSAPSAVADQVVHFTNGVTLPVRSIEKQASMYYVDLGGNGHMAFPAYLVERIERSDRVKLPPSSVDMTQHNGLMTASTYATGSDLQQGMELREAQLAKQAARKAQASKVDEIEVTASGNVVHHPHANRSTSRARQSIGITGSGAARNSGAMGRPGASTRRGGKYVIDGNRHVRRRPTGISPVAPGADSPVPLPPPDPGNSSSDSDSSGGSDQD
jgi:hypothetical protein